MGVLMTCTLAANYARTALGPVQEALKVDLALTDNQIALLQGPALAVPMIVAAVPLGFLIDTYSRARLILLLAVLDVVGTALTSVVSSVPALFLARALVGLTATTTFTAVLSVVADIYPPHQRGRANTAVSVAQIAGMSTAFALAGLLLETGPVREHLWRLVLLEMSAPLGLATVLILTLREPPRLEISGKEIPRGRDLQRLWNLRVSLGPLLVGMIGVETALGAVMTWAAPALSRIGGLSPGRIGALMATSLAISGAFGPVLGGTLADFCHRKGGVQLTIKVIAYLAAAAVPAAPFAMMMDIRWAGALLVVFLLLISAACVMGGTLFSILAPGELRGQAIAVMAAASILFAVGVAPMAVSLLAGALGGAMQLGSALSWVSAATSGAAAAVFARGRHNVQEPAHV